MRLTRTGSKGENWGRNMEKYIKISTNGKVEKIDISPEAWLDGAYKALECDTIQIVRCSPSHGGMLLVIDDNGKIEGKELNALATILYGHFPEDYIVGDVIIGWQGYRDGEPDVVELPDGLFVYMLDKLRDIGREIDSLT